MYQIEKVDLVEGVIKFEDGTEEKLTLTALINIIIDYINALLKNEF